MLLEIPSSPDLSLRFAFMGVGFRFLSFYSEIPSSPDLSLQYRYRFRVRGLESRVYDIRELESVVKFYVQLSSEEHDITRGKSGQ